MRDFLSLQALEVATWICSGEVASPSSVALLAEFQNLEMEAWGGHLG